MLLLLLLYFKELFGFCCDYFLVYDFKREERDKNFWCGKKNKSKLINFM